MVSPSQPHCNVLEQCLAQGKALQNPSTGPHSRPVTGESQTLNASLGRNSLGDVPSSTVQQCFRQRT